MKVYFSLCHYLSFQYDLPFKIKVRYTGHDKHHLSSGNVLKDGHFLTISEEKRSVFETHEQSLVEASFS